MPSPPEILNELFLEKEKKLSEERKEIVEVIKNLKAPKQDSDPYSNYKYFEGISGIKAMWYELANYISKTDSDVTKVYLQKKEEYEKMVGFYDEFHKIRSKLKGRYKMILPFDDRELGKRREKENRADAKYDDLKNQAGWGVIGEKLYVQTMTGKLPIAFLISHKKIAKTFEQVFDKLWKIAKK